MWLTVSGASPYYHVWAGSRVTSYTKICSAATGSAVQSDCCVQLGSFITHIQLM